MAALSHRVCMKLFLTYLALFIPASEAVPRLKRATDDFQPCSSKTTYVRGFVVADTLEDLLCEGRPKPYWGQVTQCSWRAREKMSAFHWNECPAGYFFKNIDPDSNELLCCKPANHPLAYQDRVDKEVDATSETLLCDEGYFVCGTYDKICDDQLCTQTLKCCKMFDPIPAPETSDDVIVRVQDDTQVPLSFLAHFLGYGWCAGCRSRAVGENFVRTERGWAADKSGTCTGYKSDQRLSIDYFDWAWKQSEVREWEEEMTINVPDYVNVLKGRHVNNGTAVQTFRVGNEITRQHRIKHTTMSRFTFSHGVEVKVSYSAKLFDLVSASSSHKYNFYYENVEQQIKEEENGETRTLSYEATITVNPCTAINYTIILYTSKATTINEAEFQPLFSVQLNGFLRYGGGYNGADTNYHQSYRGNSDRPTVPHTFGNSKKSFYDDLRDQVDKGEKPWQWSNMISRHNPLATTVINLLTNSSKHDFTLKSKIEESAYTKADIQFQEEPIPGCQKEKEQSTLEDRSKRSVSESKENSLDNTRSSLGEYNGSTETSTISVTQPGNTKSSTDLGNADPPGWSGSGESHPKVWTKSVDLSTGVWSDVDGLPSIPLGGKPKVKQTQQDSKKVIYFMEDQDLTKSHDFEIQFGELPDMWVSHGTMLVPLSFYYIPFVVIVTCVNVIYARL